MTSNESSLRATNGLEVHDHVLTVELPDGVTLDGVSELLKRNAELVGDVRAIAIVFSAGDFTALSDEFACRGAAGLALPIRRRIPVAWVVSPCDRAQALSWALRFAGWALLRGTFVERASALAWLRSESSLAQQARP